jgi:hypothetical protein
MLVVFASEVPKNWGVAPGCECSKRLSQQTALHSGVWYQHVKSLVELALALPTANHKTD